MECKWLNGKVQNRMSKAMGLPRAYGKECLDSDLACLEKGMNKVCSKSEMNFY